MLQQAMPNGAADQARCTLQGTDPPVACHLQHAELQLLLQQVCQRMLSFRILVTMKM